MSKGSRRRPLKVSKEQADANWDKIFTKGTDNQREDEEALCANSQATLSVDEVLQNENFAETNNPKS
jgi:hypothetical protein